MEGLEEYYDVDDEGVVDLLAVVFLIAAAVVALCVVAAVVVERIHDVKQMADIENESNIGDEGYEKELPNEGNATDVTDVESVGNTQDEERN